MAANSKGRVLAGDLGKRLANHIWAARDPAPLAVASPASFPSRKRGVHVSSSYDKNEDEQVRPTVVPDHVIDVKSDEYWGPHPTTGVFGPAGETSASAAGGRGSSSSSANTATSGPPSALDQTVWYRPLEDVDKTPQA